MDGCRLTTLAAAARTRPPPHLRAAPQASSPPSVKSSRGGITAKAPKEREANVGTGREIGSTGETARCPQLGGRKSRKGRRPFVGRRPPAKRRSCYV